MNVQLPVCCTSSWMFKTQTKSTKFHTVKNIKINPTKFPTWSLLLPCRCQRVRVREERLWGTGKITRSLLFSTFSIVWFFKKVGLVNQIWYCLKVHLFSESNCDVFQWISSFFDRNVSWNQSKMLWQLRTTKTNILEIVLIFGNWIDYSYRIESADQHLHLLLLGKFYNLQFFVWHFKFVVFEHLSLNCKVNFMFLDQFYNLQSSVWISRFTYHSISINYKLQSEKVKYMIRFV